MDADNQEPQANQEPSDNQEPPASPESSAGPEPAASPEPPVSAEPPAGPEPGAEPEDTPQATVPGRRRVVLTGISSRAWEHPADRGALTALRELRGFDELLKSLFGMWSDRAWRLEYLSGAIRADHRQHPRVHRIFAEAAASLDIAELPELYIEFSPMLNASCVGMSKPFIAVTSRTVELFDDDELRYVLGHELGHMVSGHAVYRTMMIILTNIARNIAWLPIGTLAIRAIMVGLMEWWRKAELSGDRAGLLAGQDPAAALRAHMKLAGGGDLSEIDTATFLVQAAEYDRTGDIRESLLKLMMLLGRTHPFPVARAAELRRWTDSGAYQRILAGDYPRRDDDRTASMNADVKAAAEEYRESFRRSEDPLMNLLRRLGEGATGVGEWVGGGVGRVRDWTGRATGAARQAASGAGRGGGGTASGGGSAAGGGTEGGDGNRANGDPWGHASDGPEGR
jgi:Zn-dependent protease with chaperone function